MLDGKLHVEKAHLEHKVNASRLLQDKLTPSACNSISKLLLTFFSIKESASFCSMFNCEMLEEKRED